MGRRTKLDYPDTTTGDVSYKYDWLSRVTTILCGTTQAAGYQYDQLDRRERVTYGNSTYITYAYDIANRLTGLFNNVTGPDITFGYTNYDKVGNRLSCSIDGQDAQLYSYDKLYQLIYAEYNDWDKTWYEYDKLGNRFWMMRYTGTVFYDSNALNQYKTVDGVAYTYDKNGNLTYDGQNTYSYDYENKLTQVKQGQSVIATYKYDFAGRRVSKADGQVITTYLYDGDSVIAEYQGTTCIRRYVFGPGVDEPICMIAVNGQSETTYYYHFDGLGSVVALSNNNGQIQERYSYDVYGEPNRVSSIGNRFMFTGREYDSETGNYYYRARYYSPKIGRFLQTDPIGYEDSMSLYQYCLNNPVNWYDPWGLAYRQSRPLDRDRFRDKAKGPFRHDRFLYDNGRDSGYYDDSQVRSDNGSKYVQDQYVNTSGWLNDRILYIAEKHVQIYWFSRKYNLCTPFFHYNCQDYANEVMMEYDRLLRQEQQQKKPNSSKVSATDPAEAPL